MDFIENNLNPVVDSQTEILVIGSMPGKISLEKQQYYGNKRNHFWKIIEAIFQQPLPQNYENQLVYLKNRRIGLWDTIQKCQRQGSLDSAIKKEIPNDFHAFFEEHPAIRCVLFNGGKAETVFKKYYDSNRWPHIEFIKMPSTSPVPGKNVKSFEEKVVIWQQAIEK